jgi:hydroxyacylglutathione hydrolase
MIDVLPVCAFRDNYIWLIRNTDNDKVAIVDPGDAGPVLTALAENNLTPAALLITHHHADHVGGVQRLLEHYNVPVFGPARETIPGCSHFLSEGDRISLDALGLTFDILEVPGHTSGHIAYYGHGCLFIGDTLFMAGCGRLFEGTPEQMHASLQKLLTLPDDTRVYCAHEYTLANLRFARTVEPDNAAVSARFRDCETLRRRNLPTVPGTLAVERQTNPFLRVDQAGVAAAAENFTGRALRDPVAVFAAIRSWKDGF